MIPPGGIDDNLAADGRFVADRLHSLADGSAGPPPRAPRRPPLHRLRRGRPRDADPPSGLARRPRLPPDRLRHVRQHHPRLRPRRPIGRAGAAARGRPDQFRRRARHAPVPGDLARRPGRPPRIGRSRPRRIEPVTGAGQEAPGTPQPAGEAIAGTHVAATPSAVDLTRFAHASEAEMARILDFYDVRWEYEPQTFPILWNLDGDVVESFAPDFYLPELGVFLEMTTLKQRLVRKKNRKLRRLRELYPDVRIKLFYARDFRAMMLKYGRFGLAESLSGTVGQVVPDRTPPADVAPAAEPVADALLATALATDEPDADAAAVAVPSSPVREPLRTKRRGRRRPVIQANEAAEREATA